MRRDLVYHRPFLGQRWVRVGSRDRVAPTRSWVTGAGGGGGGTSIRSSLTLSWLGVILVASLA